ncbi:2,4-dienoyl-CoA reductase [Azorhizobium sp. AG788]|uniref:oxidoreductase n=1 Tax=Azorhizobium sp. AG788 TaxID=2183897 RepID=UPI00105DCE49|nr:NADPH-dependent 2,4-dienoyl-CoA reductase [Azorhizobium sp. AG788]TDU00844.1 2,4-dienoyl-CoA reductase [Azorhizobium sp. AG788]
MDRYRHLLEPLSVRGFTLRNRMVMGAMHTRLETLDRASERLAAFYGVRAKGEIGLILTGGFAPNPAGIFEPGAPAFYDRSAMDEHRAVVDAVHVGGSRIVLQIVHSGRYAKHDQCVGPSAMRARINPIAPRALTTDETWQTIADFARTAALAKEAGYDGVEIMGSEGYLINQFTAPFTNDRTDAFGGSFDNRVRFPLEIIKAVRQAAGERFLVIYRISAVDLVDGGMSGSEVRELARRVEIAGADIINTGIGWHESAVPTIAASVPRGVWDYAVENVKSAVSIPVIASNRINTPDVAEDFLSRGVADLISMARPLLADPDFARKVREGRTDEINTCIACNQACLDRIFTERTATCLVNPRAGREIEFADAPALTARHIAVVGGGPAGMAFAINAAERGHLVVLFEAENELGGQLNMARVVPGKHEFNEMLRYFRSRIAALGVDVRLGKRVEAEELARRNFDEIVIATGVRPRMPDLAGLNHPKVLSYVDVLKSVVPVGRRVAIIGAGGIGFDVADYLVGDERDALDAHAFLEQWGADATLSSAGGLAVPHAPSEPPREVFMLQRKPEALGRKLGKSTGWILKTRLKRANVSMIAGAEYREVNDHGLRYSVDGVEQLLEVDHVIVCTGQEPERDLFIDLQRLGLSARLIGGADVAAELDALRAIDQATHLAVEI